MSQRHRNRNESNRGTERGSAEGRFREGQQYGHAVERTQYGDETRFGTGEAGHEHWSRPEDPDRRYGEGVQTRQTQRAFEPGGGRAQQGEGRQESHRQGGHHTSEHQGGRWMGSGPSERQQDRGEQGEYRRRRYREGRRQEGEHRRRPQAHQGEFEEGRQESREHRQEHRDRRREGRESDYGDLQRYQ